MFATRQVDETCGAGAGPVLQPQPPPVQSDCALSALSALSTTGPPRSAEGAAGFKGMEMGRMDPEAARLEALETL
jgi:hypothetical protein